MEAGGHPPALRRPGLRPPGGHRAPRRQARQRACHPRGRRQDHGLRHRPPAVLDHDQERAGAGHRALHGPRADRRGQGRSPRRHLLRGRHRLRAAGRPQALRRRQPDGRDVQGHARAPRPGQPAQERVLAGPRDGRHAGPGARPGRALPDPGRDARRAGAAVARRQWKGPPAAPGPGPGPGQGGPRAARGGALDPGPAPGARGGQAGAGAFGGGGLGGRPGAGRTACPRGAVGGTGPGRAERPATTPGPCNWPSRPWASRPRTRRPSA